MIRHAGRHSRPSLLASVAASAVRAVRFVRTIRITLGPGAPAGVRDDDFTRATVHAAPLVPFPMAADDLAPFADYRYPYDPSKGSAA